MRFISNGDYLLPLHVSTYWAQHVYTWSYERGAANPDGIMRLPGRLIDIIVFGLVGNLGFGYFYLASCLLIAFFSFLWFARKFLDSRRWGTAILGALFFACNPIFLGNLSKVGLILAVAMLPLALTAIKQAFTQKRLIYFLIYILALNMSLLHPFTFTLNLLVSGGYGLWLARQHMPFVRDNMWKLGGLAIVALLLNAYFILPLASLRTLDKGALSDTVASTPVDYTGLVDIANTGDIFTGLSLSKGVLKDYEFFGPLTWPFYFAGIFLFYALLFSAYVRVEKHAKAQERRRFVWALGIFLVLLVLATASYLHADVLIKFLIGLPGGWMFRSPLKWQLYMPLVLFTALVISLKYVQQGWRLKMLYAAFGFSFLLMNGYLGVQIYERLLTPRSLTHFAAFEQADVTNKNLLFADSSKCMTITRDNPRIATELNQVLIAKPLQVKHVQTGDIDSVNLSQYDFVMGCKGTLDEKLLTQTYHFTIADNFVNGNYQLFKNQKPTPYIAAAATVFSIEEPKNIGGKYALADHLGQPFSFTLDKHTSSGLSLEDMFDTLTADSLRGGRVHGSALLPKTGAQLLSLGTQPAYYSLQKNELELSATQKPGMQTSTRVAIKLNTPSERLHITYEDSSLTYKNDLQNPSLEAGLWQKRVGDCNEYDDKANLSMQLDTTSKTDGRQSLVLSANNHIACTGPDDIPIQAGQHYLLSFDYRTDGDRSAGYFVGFDNPTKTSINKRLPDTANQWQTFTTEFTAVADTSHAHLLVYGYPASALGAKSIAAYDNFKLIKIPNITNQFFTLSGTAPGTAPHTTFIRTNPTKSVVTIHGATAPFYLTTKETYNRLWQLSFSQKVQTLGSPPPIIANHVRLNSTMNGWYIEPATLCAQTKASCTKQPDGSYDIALVMQFAPQHWFYIGTLVSGITAIGVILFAAYDVWRHRKARQ